MKCRYDPKYALQYKSKHTKHVKLSKKVRFPLDTEKWYPNRECPHIQILILLFEVFDIFNNFNYPLQHLFKFNFF